MATRKTIRDKTSKVKKTGAAKPKAKAKAKPKAKPRAKPNLNLSDFEKSPTTQPSPKKQATKAPKGKAVATTKAPKGKAVATTPKATGTGVATTTGKGVATTTGKGLATQGKLPVPQVGIPVRQEKLIGSGPGEPVTRKALPSPAKSAGKKVAKAAAKTGLKRIAAGALAVAGGPLGTALAVLGTAISMAPDSGRKSTGGQMARGKKGPKTAPKTALTGGSYGVLKSDAAEAAKGKTSTQPAKVSTKKAGSGMSDFGKAFSKAHDSGADTFTYKGELKNTKRADGSETKARKAAKAKTKASNKAKEVTPSKKAPGTKRERTSPRKPQM